MPKASDIMTRDVVTVTIETSIRELAQKLLQRSINGVPVIDEEKRVIGVVCESDLVEFNKPLHIPTVFVILDSIIPMENPWRLHKDLKRIAATKVGDIYSHPATTVDPETDVSEIARIMSEHKYYTIPVVDNELLVGVIGKVDIVKSLI
ncbi:MAG: CBS domain-containing protein [Deltaproteobacteria bacterium]|nr:CBS domain-containing protein [Deltaproteobacteria bacterium]